MKIGRRETLIGILFAIFVAFFTNYSSLERLLDPGKGNGPMLIMTLVFSLVWFCVVSMANYLLYVWMFNSYKKKDNPVLMGLSLFGATVLMGLVFMTIYPYVRELFYNDPYKIMRAHRRFVDMARGLNAATYKHILIAVLNLLFVYIQRLLYTNQQLQLESVKSRHSALVQQVNPHFFFNSLSTLRYSIMSDSPEKSVELLDNLTAIFRKTLKMNENNLYTLSEELELTQSYLYIIQKRFEGKIIVNFEIEESYLMAKLSPLSLLTLMENVIKHNKISIKNPVVVKVFTTDKGELVVENNIVPKFEPVESHGIGLVNLNMQYELLTGRGITVEKRDKSFRVILQLIIDKDESSNN